MPFCGKYESIVPVKKISFPANHCVFEFSCRGKRGLAEIWFLNHFSRTRLSYDFCRLGGFPSEEKKFLFETVKEILSLRRMLHGVKFVQKELI